MDFDLLYEGQLPSDQGSGRSPKVAHKQRIRGAFHDQLCTLVNKYPELAVPDLGDMHAGRISNSQLVPVSGVGASRCFIMLGGKRYIPLLTSRMGIVCDLTITILSSPVTNKKFDTDNRLKTLRDALRIPHVPQEVKGSEDVVPDPCYCLLEDDGDELIAGVNSVPRLLLKPPSSGHEDEVVVWIYVRIHRPKSVWGVGP